MSLKIRKLFEPRKTIGYAIEDPETGHFFDFVTRLFDPNPDNSIQELVEDWLARAEPNRFLRGAFANVTQDSPQLDTPASVFHPGQYIIYYIDRTDVDRAIKVETWVAEKSGDGIELRPQDSIPTPVPVVAAFPIGSGTTSTGPTYNFHLPSGFTLGGDLKLTADITGVQPVPPGPGAGGGPNPGPGPNPEPGVPDPTPPPPAPGGGPLPPPTPLPPPPTPAPAPTPTPAPAPAPGPGPGEIPPDQMPQPDQPAVQQAARPVTKSVLAPPPTTSPPMPARRPPPGGRPRR
jgi:hypothetical protein